MNRKVAELVAHPQEPPRRLISLNNFRTIVELFDKCDTRNDKNQMGQTSEV
jgi:hypothetical protein